MDAVKANFEKKMKPYKISIAWLAKMNFKSK